MPGAGLSSRFARLFDHSVVRPDATQADVVQAAQIAASLGTATLTVQPHYITLGLGYLRGSSTLLGTVVGFPHGNETASMKRFQARTVMELGAQEIDMVMNIPALKNGEQALFMDDIAGVVEQARGATVKVILENGFLSDDEKRRACEWIARAGAHFVKTSTAFAEGGATLHDVRLMYAAVNGRCLVKAAGGVRTLDQVLEFLRAGARRFGSTRTDSFVAEFDLLPVERQALFQEFLPQSQASALV